MQSWNREEGIFRAFICRRNAYTLRYQEILEKIMKVNMNSKKSNGDVDSYLWNSRFNEFKIDLKMNDF